MIGIRRYGCLFQRGVVLAVTACVGGCAVGPDYHRPAVQIPESFKEGADWERAQGKPAEPISNTWWLVYRDDRLTHLIEQSLQANQSIVAAEAAYRVALATVQANVASLFPVISADVSASRTGSGTGVSATGRGTSPAATVPGVYNTVAASVSASWEPDLWGGIRRAIESAKGRCAGDRCPAGRGAAVDHGEYRECLLPAAAGPISTSGRCGNSRTSTTVFLR